MKKVKVLLSAAVLIATVAIVLALNVIRRESVHEAKNIGIQISAKKTQPSKKEVKAYSDKQQKLQSALAAYFKNAIQTNQIVGAGISIVQGDSILFSDGFGKRNVNQNTKVNGHTVFRLGSLSKGFAGVLAASLQKEGKLDWDDKIVDYIPGFQFGDSINTHKIKLSHVMSHSSGTPYHSYTNLIEAGLPVANIALRFTDVTPQSPPGQQYSYQNAMFSLSQEVMRSVTGKNVKTLLQDRFFVPLDMSHISMDHESLLEEKNVAMPHSRRGKGWRSLPLRNKYYNAVVAGGINASSLDMAKWMRFLLGHNPEVLPSSTIQNAFNPFIEVGANNKYYQRWSGHQQSHYAYGWRIHEFQQVEQSERQTVWHHGGSVNNYRNEIALFPEGDIGICVLLNGNSRLAQTVIPDIYTMVKALY